MIPVTRLLHPLLHPRRGLWTGAAVLQLGVALASPGVASAQDPTSSFAASADLVRVDAVVLDSRGNPVEGLEQGDFVVREDGRIQTVQEFEAVALPEAAPSSSPTRSFVSTNARPEAAHRAARSFAIVFDDAQLSKPTAERARAAVARFLETGLRADDEVILLSTATNAWWSARLGDGRDDLLAVLGRLDGRRVVDTTSSFMTDYEAMRIYTSRDRRLGAEVTRRLAENGVIPDPATAEGVAVANELGIGEGHPLVRAKAAEVYLNQRTRNQATLRALARVASALAPGRGRKSVLLVSDGFVHDPSLTEFKDVLSAMSRANASVYFLDARGVTGSSEFASAEFGRALLEQDVSSTLGRLRLETQGAESVAADTGGYSFRNPNDLAGGLERVAHESRSYYLLGYTSRNAARDGKLRKIEVQVRRPGLKVRARRGYYAPSDAPAAPRGAGELDPQVREGLDSPFPLDAIPLRMAVYVFGPGLSARSRVLVVAEADPESMAPGAPDGPLEATLDSYLVVATRDGSQNVPVEKEVSISLPATARARFRQAWLPLYREVELEPGVYQARLLLRDRKSGRTGTVRHEFEVPANAPLWTSTPILTDTLQGDPKAGPTRPVPVARRSFASGATLVYVFEVYGAQADAAGPRVTSACEVQSADGSPLVKGAPKPIQPGPQGELGVQVPISLQGAPPGDYRIVLTVEDQVAGQRLQVVDPFTIAPSGSAPTIPPSGSTSSPGRP